MPLARNNSATNEYAEGKRGVPMAASSASIAAAIAAMLATWTFFVFAVCTIQLFLCRYHRERWEIRLHAGWRHAAISCIGISLIGLCGEGSAVPKASDNKKGPVE